MKYLLKTLSILFDYPRDEFRELVEVKDDVYKVLATEDEEAARLIYEFLNSINPEDADEYYVSIFEMPAQCPLYAHHYTLKNKQEQVGQYLLEIKMFFKVTGYDVPIKKELPDFLPVMLEYLSAIIEKSPEIAYEFAKKYIDPWLDDLYKCLEDKAPGYALLVRALKRAIQELGNIASKNSSTGEGMDNRN